MSKEKTLSDKEIVNVVVAGPMEYFRTSDIQDDIKRIKERIKKYYKKDTNILHMSYDLFCLELNMVLGDKFK